MSPFLLIAVLFAVIWFAVLVPQRRRQRAHVAMQDSVGVGDEIITAGGMHGEVVADEGEIVRVEIADGVVVRLDRRAIAAVARDVEEDEELAEFDAEAHAEASEPSEAR